MASKVANLLCLQIGTLLPHYLPFFLFFVIVEKFFSLLHLRYPSCQVGQGRLWLCLARRKYYFFTV